jgi:hypothetical protein
MEPGAPPFAVPIDGTMHRINEARGPTRRPGQWANLFRGLVAWLQRAAYMGRTLLPPLVRHVKHRAVSNRHGVFTHANLIASRSSL